MAYAEGLSLSFTLFGAATYQIFVQGNGNQEEWNSAAKLDPLPGGHDEFAYDNAGNRQSSNRTGVGSLQDNYTTNALNQYSSRENNTLPISGTANMDSGVAVKRRPPPAAMGGIGPTRFWSIISTSPGMAHLIFSRRSRAAVM